MLEQMEEDVYLLDYDGSAGEIVVMKSLRGFRTLHDANPKLNQRIAADVAKPHVTQVSIQLTSLRNSEYLNRVNNREYHNGCAYTEMSKYTNTLKSIHGDKINHRKMLVQDYQQGKAPGTTWDAVITKKTSQRSL